MDAHTDQLVGWYRETKQLPMAPEVQAYGDKRRREDELLRLGVTVEQMAQALEIAKTFDQVVQPRDEALKMAFSIEPFHGR